jgi:ABC-type Zn uptake system ZnuABC Zn-binding protein ZnuA
MIRNKGIKMIIMDNFYSDSAPNQLAQLTGVKVVKIPSAVYGIKNINSYIDLMDYIVKAITKNS